MDCILKAEHLQVGVKSSAKISAEMSPFSGGLAHLHKLVAVMASFVPPSLHPFKFLGEKTSPLCAAGPSRAPCVEAHAAVLWEGRGCLGVMFMKISKGL